MQNVGVSGVLWVMRHLGKEDIIMFKAASFPFSILRLFDDMAGKKVFLLLILSGRQITIICLSVCTH